MTAWVTTTGNLVDLHLEAIHRSSQCYGGTVAHDVQVDVDYVRLAAE